jgi:hypothetical protein
MPPRILKITKNEPHGETITEIEIPDDEIARPDDHLQSTRVSPSMTVLAHTRSADGAHCGFHAKTIDLTGVTAITLED